MLHVISCKREEKERADRKENHRKKVEIYKPRKYQKEEFKKFGRLKIYHPNKKECREINIKIFFSKKRFFLKKNSLNVCRLENYMYLCNVRKS